MTFDTGRQVSYGHELEWRLKGVYNAEGTKAVGDGIMG